MGVSGRDKAPLAQAFHTFTCETTGTGFYQLTSGVQHWLADIGADNGLLTLFMRHTSASLTIQENADHTVVLDLRDALARLAPENFPYRHTMEGPDDMPAHIKSMLSSTSLAVPVQGGLAVLGTWQGIFAIEHRRHAHQRKIAGHYHGTFN